MDANKGEGGGECRRIVRSDDGRKGRRSIQSVVVSYWEVEKCFVNQKTIFAYFSEKLNFADTHNMYKIHTSPNMQSNSIVDSFYYFCVIAHNVCEDPTTICLAFSVI